MIVLRALAVALALFVPAAGRAVDVADLYVGSAVVTGTEEPERTRGLKLALLDVIVKLTGDARLAESAALAPLLDEPKRFVETIAYEDRMKGIPVHDEQGTRERPHTLTAAFRKGEIDAALAALNLSLWGSDRPLVAVRLEVKTEAGRFLITAEGPEGYGQRLALVETARRRGVPILLPDEAETLDDGSGQGAAPRTAKGADAALTGTLSLTEGGTWDVAWTLTAGDRERQWGLKAVTFDTAIRSGIERTALHLAGREGERGRMTP